MLRVILSAGFALLTWSCLYGQATFEVASIKLSPPQAPGHTSSRMSVDTGRLNYTNVTLKDVVGQAYKVQAYQIAGPDWIETERFDIAAKIPALAARDQVPLMLQVLLADRFNMVFHREVKELPVYALNVVKNVPKLKTAESESGITSNSNRTSWHVVAKIPMRRFAEFLSERVNRPVLDQTGLNGSFEFTLDWAIDDASATNDGLAGPSIFTALQEQLGLKLNSTKGPVETFVIDHADRAPSDN
ncbi:MAG: TIGR03435 family protein [Acidobacteriia bacterium]|nr:TIGR03435 family protein [Terriglobia bacterium]